MFGNSFQSIFHLLHAKKKNQMMKTNNWWIIDSYVFSLGDKNSELFENKKIWWNKLNELAIESHLTSMFGMALNLPR